MIQIFLEIYLTDCPLYITLFFKVFKLYIENKVTISCNVVPVHPELLV